MNKDQMIKWGVIIGGGVLAYWYVTSYGPHGAVSAGNVSWWDTWFSGASAPAPVAAASTGPVVAASTGPVVAASTGTQTTQPGYPNQPSSIPSGQPVITQSPVRQQILAASSGDPAVKGGYAIPDVWSYYWQQATGITITPQQFATMMQGSTAPLNLDQFLAKLPIAAPRPSALLALDGLSGIGSIVSVPSIPSIPAMNFGGSFRRPGMRGMGGRGLQIQGGGTIIQ
jgi:hypothetical protein